MNKSISLIALISIITLMLGSCASGNLQDYSAKGVFPEPEEEVKFDTPPTIDVNQIQEKLVYPETLLNAGIEGKVFMKVLIDIEGEVEDILIEESDNNMFTKAAIEAVKQADATPAKFDGKPINAWLDIPVLFRLR